ncbi:hypothetical protein PBI_MRMAGOO_165 [Mycobacterium phage MrMagoo]|uniref:Uncharacterized protein n=1 Tax=Mycobacterium phage MrMagoo TaxID=1927020 RepID=A0A1L6BYR4_9CAUD|nr:hypothetical protein J4U04_gp115 [Mycobacterium phage MrMagoo]APQ42247.1 hypothetical protein PBI_MRMAGOO_165 [Mycobacterium phage MrMagoo]ARM70316.1 hypothetical protein SEA_GARDENSALSA_163 [Mycobacterium phage GardenSalsa]
MENTKNVQRWDVYDIADELADVPGMLADAIDDDRLIPGIVDTIHKLTERLWDASRVGGVVVPVSIIVLPVWFKDTVTLEGVGDVVVSTKYFGGSMDYWETAILWPEGWAGSVHYQEDGFEVAACNRGYEAGREAAVLAHRTYMDPHVLSGLARTIASRPEEVYA